MKKNYIQPAATYQTIAAKEDYLTTSIPVTDENVDDSGKAKGFLFDDDEMSEPVRSSVWN